jgi:transcriptional regulator with XRE-family HTH domain
MASKQRYLARVAGPALLKSWRKSLKLSQQRAAFLLDLDVGAVCAFETGYKSPGLERAQQIEAKTGGAVPVSSWPNDPQPRGRRAA